MKVRASARVQRARTLIDAPDEHNPPEYDEDERNPGEGEAFLDLDTPKMGTDPVVGGTAIAT